MRLLIVLSTFLCLSGCNEYESHTLPYDISCEEICGFIGEGCSFNQVDVENTCLNSCYMNSCFQLSCETSDFVPESEARWACAECIVNTAQCLTDDINSLCVDECNL